MIHVYINIIVEDGEIKIDKLNSRLCEKYIDGSWHTCRMKHLMPNDIFRLSEPDGQPVLDKDGNTIFKALDFPYKNKYSHVWTIDCEGASI